MVSRRGFLRGLPVGVTAAAAALKSLEATAQAAAQAPASEEEYWRRVRQEFLLDKDWTYLNNGTLGPTPKPVYYTLAERYHDLAQDPGQPNTDQNNAQEEVRKKAAAFVGADVDEISLVRNTTEGMNFMLSGVDLQAGDEILTTFHEHGGGMTPCQLKAKRHGVVIKTVRWKAPAEDPGVILNAFNDAITPRTRLMMVSHVMYQSGSMLPMKELAVLARWTGRIRLAC
jgi:selenocysteine lyase/cysteine desulfurase